MTVLQAIQSASVRVIGRKPSTVFSSVETFEQELADLSNEVAADIAKSADWQALLRVAVIMGDGVTDAFDFPSNYDRQPVHADILDAQFTAWGYARETDLNAFLRCRQGAIGASPGIWTIYGSQIQFCPAPPNGAEAEFFYVDRQYATDINGTPKDAFDTDNDLFRLPERLLTLGLVWRWRQNKGLSSGEDEAAFSKAFAEASGRDRGSRIFSTGPMRMPGNIYPSYPWSLGP
jgi:hypothetical protein